MTSPYDPFAWFYNRYWAEPFQTWQAPVLDRLLPGPCRILDLCCGTGHLARRLLDRGYEVTGVDSSAEMLRHAWENAPAAQFLEANATDFAVLEPFDVAISTFDSLNHLLDERQVALCFRCIHEALKPGGTFLFDINTEAAYGPEWDGFACHVEPDHVFFLRGGYDARERRGTTEITMFRQLESWQRFDVEVQQRPWRVAEMQALLAANGFDGIEHFSPLQDLGVAGHYGQGRVYFRSCQNSGTPRSSSSA